MGDELSSYMSLDASAHLKALSLLTIVKNSLKENKT